MPRPICFMIMAKGDPAREDQGLEALIIQDVIR